MISSDLPARTKSGKQISFEIKFYMKIDISQILKKQNIIQHPSKMAFFYNVSLQHLRIGGYSLAPLNRIKSKKIAIRAVFWCFSPKKFTVLESLQYISNKVPTRNK